MVAVAAIVKFIKSTAVIVRIWKYFLSMANGKDYGKGKWRPAPSHGNNYHKRWH